MKILIAEDDPASRQILKITLDKWGYEVVVAVTEARPGKHFRPMIPPDWPSSTG